jgi:monomeric sarcosine oxidase
VQRFDVLVLGVGSMGGAAANELAERGLSVLGLEAFWPGHDQGSAHGGTRIIRQSYFEGPAYVPLLQRAYERWYRLEEESGRDLMTLCGGIYIGDPASKVVTGSLLSARLNRLDHELLDAGEIRRRFPGMRPAEHAVGLYEANAGYTRPELTTIANAEVAARKGATIRYGERATSWSATPHGGVEVVTAEGVYGADRLVITPGAWAPQVLQRYGFPIRIERQVFYWIEPDFTEVPYAEYSDERHPVYIEETDRNGEIYGFPMTEGPEGGMKLAFFRKGIETTPETIDREVHDLEKTEMRRRALQLFPHLTGRFVDAKTCMYSTTPDEHFLVGALPDLPQVVIACGFSGHGFKFVPVIGEVVADLVTAGSTRHDIGLFDLHREALRT